MVAKPIQVKLLVPDIVLQRRVVCDSDIAFAAIEVHDPKLDDIPSLELNGLIISLYCSKVLVREGVAGVVFYLVEHHLLDIGIHRQQLALTEVTVLQAALVCCAIKPVADSGDQCSDSFSFFSEDYVWNFVVVGKQAVKVGVAKSHNLERYVWACTAKHT